MCLVEDHVVPHLALENVCVPARESVRGNTHVEVVLVVPSLPQFLATFGRTMITQNPETREKLFKLHLPVEQHARRNNLGNDPRQQRCSWRNTIRIRLDVVPIFPDRKLNAPTMQSSESFSYSKHTCQQHVSFVHVTRTPAPSHPPRYRSAYWNATTQATPTHYVDTVGAPHGEVAVA